MYRQIVFFVKIWHFDRKEDNKIPNDNPRPPNGPSTTGNPSGGGRGNNPPKK
ncbi:hypothetical protein [Campylobacter upsaliensis]|uniref:hypothetical protein n=1 Tax=Campylobacter upsaliensis TaxID=28080 RepID=UPI0022EA1B1A|nr:hypothetical protein [Campylobacter upsaliensis]